MTKTLTQLLVEISKGGIKEKCYIKIDEPDESFIRFEEFMIIHAKEIKDYIVVSYSHNDLIMCWEIKVRKEVNNASK